MTNARKSPIPFEVFASFKRIETGNPTSRTLTTLYLRRRTIPMLLIAMVC
jgi:hypothetical protein